MPPTFRLSPATEVPEGSRVCHYDELPEPAKERLPAVADPAGATTSDPAFESAADAFDLVKFTDYYRIERV
jgi:hypothetical protein